METAVQTKDKHAEACRRIEVRAKRKGYQVEVAYQDGQNWAGYAVVGFRGQKLDSPVELSSSRDLALTEVVYKCQELYGEADVHAEACQRIEARARRKGYDIEVVYKQGENDDNFYAIRTFEGKRLPADLNIAPTREIALQQVESWCIGLKDAHERDESKEAANVD